MTADGVGEATERTPGGPADQGSAPTHRPPRRSGLWRDTVTGQTRTAVVAAAAFVLTASLLMTLPTPFVVWSPGVATDTLGSHDGAPLVSVAGIATYPTTGQLDLTTVLQSRVDSRVSLLEALIGYLAPDRDVLPRASIYPEGTTADQSRTAETVAMQTSQHHAVVAALRAQGTTVTARPAVAEVTVSGPAYGHLQPGDLITAVDGRAVSSADDVRAGITRRPTGSELTFAVIRDRAPLSVRVTSRASGTSPSRAVVGITVGVGYSYAPEISFDLGDRIGGPSAGLVFSLAIYDKITPGALLGGRHVAGTGTIDPDGSVGPIGGIQQKIAGARDDGATVFLVPGQNCADLAGVSTDLDLIRADTLRGAIDALGALDRGDAAAVPRC